MKDQLEKKKIKLQTKIQNIIDGGNAKIAPIQDEIAKLDTVINVMTENGL